MIYSQTLTVSLMDKTLFTNKRVNNMRVNKLCSIFTGRDRDAPEDGTDPGDPGDGGDTCYQI